MKEHYRSSKEENKDIFIKENKQDMLTVESEARMSDQMSESASGTKKKNKKVKNKLEKVPVVKTKKKAAVKKESMKDMIIAAHLSFSRTKEAAYKQSNDPGLAGTYESLSWNQKVKRKKAADKKKVWHNSAKEFNQSYELKQQVDNLLQNDEEPDELDIEQQKESIRTFLNVKHTQFKFKDDKEFTENLEYNYQLLEQLPVIEKLLKRYEAGEDVGLDNRTIKQLYPQTVFLRDIKEWMDSRRELIADPYYVLLSSKEAASHEGMLKALGNGSQIGENDLFNGADKEKTDIWETGNDNVMRFLRLYNRVKNCRFDRKRSREEKDYFNSFKRQRYEDGEYRCADGIKSHNTAIEKRRKEEEQRRKEEEQRRKEEEERRRKEEEEKRRKEEEQRRKEEEEKRRREEEQRRKEEEEKRRKEEEKAKKLKEQQEKNRKAQEERDKKWKDAGKNYRNIYIERVDEGYIPKLKKVLNKRKEDLFNNGVYYENLSDGLYKNKYLVPALYAEQMLGDKNKTEEQQMSDIDATANAIAKELKICTPEQKQVKVRMIEKVFLSLMKFDISKMDLEDLTDLKDMKADRFEEVYGAAWASLQAKDYISEYSALLKEGGMEFSLSENELSEIREKINVMAQTTDYLIAMGHLVVKNTDIVNPERFFYKSQKELEQEKGRLKKGDKYAARIKMYDHLIKLKTQKTDYEGMPHADMKRYLEEVRANKKLPKENPEEEIIKKLEKGALSLGQDYYRNYAENTAQRVREERRQYRNAEKEKQRSDRKAKNVVTEDKAAIEALKKNLNKEVMDGALNFCRRYAPQLVSSKDTDPQVLGTYVAGTQQNITNEHAARMFDILSFDTESMWSHVKKKEDVGKRQLKRLHDIETIMLCVLKFDVAAFDHQNIYELAENKNIGLLFDMARMSDVCEGFVKEYDDLMDKDLGIEYVITKDEIKEVKARMQIFKSFYPVITEMKKQFSGDIRLVPDGSFAEYVARVRKEAGLGEADNSESIAEKLEAKWFADEERIAEEEGEMSKYEISGNKTKQTRKTAPANPANGPANRQKGIKEITDKYPGNAKVMSDADMMNRINKRLEQYRKSLQRTKDTNKIKRLQYDISVCEGRIKWLEQNGAGKVIEINVSDSMFDSVNGYKMDAFDKERPLFPHDDLTNGLKQRLNSCYIVAPLLGMIEMGKGDYIRKTLVREYGDDGTKAVVRLHDEDGQPLDIVLDKTGYEEDARPLWLLLVEKAAAVVLNMRGFGNEDAAKNTSTGFAHNVPWQDFDKGYCKEGSIRINDINNGSEDMGLRILLGKTALQFTTRGGELYQDTYCYDEYCDQGDVAIGMMKALLDKGKIVLASTCSKISIQEKEAARKQAPGCEPYENNYIPLYDAIEYDEYINLNEKHVYNVTKVNIKGDGVDLLDPLTGRYKQISLKNFRRYFTDIRAAEIDEPEPEEVKQKDEEKKADEK